MFGDKSLRRSYMSSNSSVSTLPWRKTTVLGVLSVEDWEERAVCAFCSWRVWSLVSLLFFLFRFTILFQCDGDGMLECVMIK